MNIDKTYISLWGENFLICLNQNLPLSSPTAERENSDIVNLKFIY